jgi:hypothetical protein
VDVELGEVGHPSTAAPGAPSEVEGQGTPS